MTAETAETGSSLPRLRTGLIQVGCGFLFWLAFVLLLEPGNVVRAARAGAPLDGHQEAIRMVCAATLGSPTWPLLMGLSRRFPVAGRAFARNALILAACIATLATAMIVIARLAASVLAPAVQQVSLGEQLASNIFLLMVAMAVLVGATQVSRRLGARPAEAAQAVGIDANRLVVTTRGRTVMIDVGAIDWIEAQGNYLALHVGPATHMVRETMASREANLDPAAFVRIHRRTIVNLLRIRDIRPLGNGDSLVRLDTGAELRASRGYREALRTAMLGSATEV